MPTCVVRNQNHLADFLRGEIVRNAYQLGYLDPSYADGCTWLGCREDGELTALVLVYTGLRRAAIFTAGQRDGIQKILREQREHLPAKAVIHVSLPHRDAILSAYKPVGELTRMGRMALRRADFLATPPDVPRHPVVTLGHADVGAILQLYSVWPDNLFEPYQLESRLYFGVRDASGALVAIAGAHNLSETYDVAAIGNLVTHPDHRGRGYALSCSVALLDVAFQRVSLVTLDVPLENEPAVRTYQHLGFQLESEFYEGNILAAEPVTLGPAALVAADATRAVQTHVVQTRALDVRAACPLSEKRPKPRASQLRVQRWLNASSDRAGWA